MSPSALWCVSPHLAEHRDAELGHGVLVHTLFSGISRGTERLVLSGAIPESEFSRMRGPHQEGDFPFPVKYGYSAVGQIAEGAEKGQMVFALHPHQDVFRLPADALMPIPDQVPVERAVLAANMETALNILWDSGVQAGDRVAVVGAGVVGSLVGYLAAQIPGTEVTLVDTRSKREGVATALGCRFAAPDTAPDECDVVVHASASEAGLATSLSLAGPDATVVEASWHGVHDVSVALGGAFHSKRLRLVSSQVGRIPATHSARWTHARRMSTAINLLADPALDLLITGETSFGDLPAEYGNILSDPDTLCHRVSYPLPKES
jgi:threonine dehydrogenase-like Zn-dependent dehydrogenase